MTDADERRVRKTLQGLEFPVHKDTLIAYASARGPDPKTMRALQALPEGEYGNTDAVEQAVPQRPEQA
jgi:hypothetical protein